MYDRLSKERIREPLVEIDEEKRKAALISIGRAADRHKTVYHPPWWELLAGQLRYISRAAWLGQGGFLAAAILLYGLFRNQEEQIRLCLIYSSMVAAGVGGVAVMELSKSIACHMAEIEQSCYFNLGQIWSLRLILLGGADLCVLACLILGLWVRGSFGLVALGLYLLVPFVLSNLCYLFFLTAGRKLGGRKSSASVNGGMDSWLQITMVLFMCLLAAAPSTFPMAYDRASLWVWAAAFLIGSVLLAAEVRMLIVRASVSGKELQWE